MVPACPHELTPPWWGYDRAGHRGATPTGDVFEHSSLVSEALPWRDVGQHLPQDDAQGVHVHALAILHVGVALLEGKVGLKGYLQGSGQGEWRGSQWCNWGGKRVRVRGALEGGTWRPRESRDTAANLCEISTSFAHSSGAMYSNVPVHIGHSACHPVASHRSTSHRITSDHITSDHITSQHIILHHITSHHTTSHHITSISYHIASHRITPHHIKLQHIV